MVLRVETRVKKIFNCLEEKPDIIIIKNSSEPFIDENFFYVTGLQKGLFEGSIAVLFPDGKIDLIVSELESETASKTDLHLEIYRTEEDFKKILKKSYTAYRTIGLNYNGVKHKDYVKLKKIFSKSSLKDVSKAFVGARAIKEGSELELMKKAASISDKVMEKIPEILHHGMTENELAAEINYLMQKNSADKPAFETISSFGENTAEPHYTHGDKKIKSGDFIICDFGASYKKYNSDITRTFVFGDASSKQKEMYQTVLKAQKTGFEKIKENVKACEVHRAVAKFIDETIFKGRFIHSTGHSLGMLVHDGGPGFRTGCKEKLKENMVLTVEPGVYIPGFGGVRIEDDVVIKKDGMELLTKASREFIEI